MNPYEEELVRQFCLDYDAAPEEVCSPQNLFRPCRQLPGARPAGRGSLLKLAVYREKLLVMANAGLLDWCREFFGEKRGTWLSEPRTLAAIQAKLGEWGQEIRDVHHHYLPREGFPPVCRRFPVRWYEEGELEQFRGDPRFWEALLFDEEIPDKLAVCALEGETILGMASATANSEKLWEIGVNVTDAGAGKGVGSYVTALLKEELLRRGIVPTYATVESHIKSQRVAFRAGFEPAFFELYSG